MKVNIINQNVSFNGWEKGARKTLLEVFSHLPKRKADRAIQLANDIEKNSSNMAVIIHDTSISATPTSIFDMGHRKVFSFFTDWGNKKSPLKVLEQVFEYVKKENVIIPRVKELREAFMPAVEKLKGRFRSDSGIYVGDKGKVLANELARALVIKDGEGNLEKAVKRLGVIDKKAHDNHINIQFIWYKGSFILNDNSLSKKVDLKNGAMEAFDKIEKFIDKRANAHKWAKRQYAVSDVKSQIRGEKSIYITKLLGEKLSHDAKMRKLSSKLKTVRKEYWSEVVKDIAEKVKTFFDRKKYKPETIAKKLNISH